MMLADLNIHIIKYLASQLGLSSGFMRSSQLNVETKRTQMLLDICKILKADRYVSSVGAEGYMMEDVAGKLFRNEGIAAELLEYKHSIYPQMFGEFIPNLSLLDCLFNCGPDSPKIVFSTRTRKSRLGTPLQP